ncbi:MAG: hypothetical protein V1915_02490 [Candidatus Bathyarchaeota archaeon]
MLGLKKIVEEAIKEYQQYRTEAFARLMSVDEEEIKIEFTGEFCPVCGIADDYQLLSYFLEQKGVKTNTPETTMFDEGFIATFRIIKSSIE